MAGGARRAGCRPWRRRSGGCAVRDFVEQCRREWKRLRVPDPVTEEMAAELVADLEEAKADGVSPEEVLGSGASDPRTFAASWAAERGVGRPSPSREIMARR